MTTKTHHYHLPVTLEQSRNLQSLLDAASARESNPDAEVFELLETVRKTRVDATKTPQDKPVSVTVDGQLLDALNDFREQKLAMRTPSLTQREYVAAIERLAHALDQRVRNTA